MAAAAKIGCKLLQLRHRLRGRTFLGPFRKKDSTSKRWSGPQEHRNVLMQVKLCGKFGLNPFLNVDWFCSYFELQHIELYFDSRIKGALFWWTIRCHPVPALCHIQHLKSKVFQEFYICSSQLHKRTGLKFANNPCY